MRWVLLLLAACSFEHGAASTDMTHDEAGVQRDGATIDARPIDARPLDASAQCIGQSTKTDMGHHYFVTANDTWQGTQNTCSAFGGHLVKIETAEENAFITTNFASSYVWIGLHDPTNLDVYVWTDGSALLLGYNGFAGMTPPASSMNCVDTNGTWDAYSCSSTNHGGVCECE